MTSLAPYLSPAFTGFATGFSLILAIGAQNAFVLRQGLLRSHVFWLCLFCAASDALLITAGVAGFGALTEALPWLPLVMSLAGAAFLVVYGLTRLGAAWRGGEAMKIAGQAQSLGRTIAIAAAFTWANPHVYLDTVVLIGAVSLQFQGMSKLAYGAGAATASFVFFSALGYGASLLAPKMQRPNAWRILDTVIALVMFVLAIGMARAGGWLGG